MAIFKDKMAQGKQQGTYRPQESYSVAAQEILSQKPGFFGRWALLICLVVLSATFIGGSLIRYPLIVEAPATITVAKGPEGLVPQLDGKLSQIFAANDQQVTEGQTIAWLESTANHKEIESLKAMMDSGAALLQTGKIKSVSQIFAQSFQQLGELQIPYQQFITALQQFNDYLINGYFLKREEVLRQDLHFLQAMHDTIQREKELLQQDVQLSQEGLDANSSLFKEKVISKQDMRDQRSKLVGKQLSLPQISTALLNNENAQADKKRDIDELEHAISQQRLIFQGALQTLKSLTDAWIIKYAIKAPVSGKLVLFTPLQQGQYVSAGKVLGYVNPGNSLYYAQLHLPEYNLGKIEVGQKVRLTFDAYPYAEYGYVAGDIYYISKIPSDSGFVANIELPNGLSTVQHRDIQYGSGLKAHARIITKETTLLQRLYNSVIIHP